MVTRSVCGEDLFEWAVPEVSGDPADLCCVTVKRWPSAGVPEYLPGELRVPGRPAPEDGLRLFMNRRLMTFRLSPSEANPYRFRRSNFGSQVFPFKEIPKRPFDLCPVIDDRPCQKPIARLY